MKKILLLLILVLGATGCTNIVKETNPYQTLSFNIENWTEETETFTTEIEIIQINEQPLIDNEQINIYLQAEYEILRDAFVESIEDLENFNNMKHSLIVKSTPIIYNESFISIALDVATYTGGAHGNAYTTGINYDINYDESIFVTDLTLDEEKLNSILKVFSEESYNQIIKTHPEIELDLDWVKMGTEPNISNFFNFTIIPNGIILHIPTYQVAPYAVGGFDPLIEFEKISNFIDNQTIQNLILQ